MAAKRPAGARSPAAALAAPRRGGVRAAAVAILPSGRSLLVGWAILALGIGGYAAARETSVFAIRRVEVVGAPPEIARRVERAAAGVRGTSLVGLDGAALLARVAAIPWVASARYDRAFPHTLRLIVRAERPVAVLRAGTRSWLVSANARVLARISRRSDAALPRIWVPAATLVTAGETLAATSGGAAARTLAPLTRAFPVRITSVSLAADELTFTLAGGLELRLGEPDDLRLKLAVARRILPQLVPGPGYLDVSVPERPVSAQAKVSGSG